MRFIERFLLAWIFLLFVSILGFHYQSIFVTQIISSINNIFTNESLRCANMDIPLKGNVSLSPLPSPKNGSTDVISIIAMGNPQIHPGGYFSPQDCQDTPPLDSVAIIVPYQNRSEHLLSFLQHMHPFLTRQRLEYKIYVIEQMDKDPFNRGKLINVGYREAMKDKNWSCIIIHDVDHIPLNDHNIYNCWPEPRRMIVASSEFNFRYAAPYRNCFGGVTAILSSQFEALNGFHNDYYGWGGEDDDFAVRIKASGMEILMYNETIGMEIGRYKTLPHKKAVPAKDRHKKVKQAHSNRYRSGLNSLRYDLISRKEEPLYTLVSVELLYYEYLQRKKLLKD